MLKILSGEQVKALDAAHVRVQQIQSLQLMERAALAFVSWWDRQDFDPSLPVSIFCGSGNNGGDGFAIARLLSRSGRQVSVFRCFGESASLSPDAAANLEALPSGVENLHWTEFDARSRGVLIDAFLGVGLKGALRQDAKEMVQAMNAFVGTRIAVDIPSGLPADGLLEGECVQADTTVTFAFPKLSLLFPEHAFATGALVLADIGISDGEYSSFASPYFYLREKDVKVFHRSFHRFSHKGDFGKILLFAGSKGKMGAAVLCCKSALRTGSGLVTALIPEGERHVLQSSLPEGMCLFDLEGDLNRFDAIGLGPGIGVEDSAKMLADIFRRYSRPVVLDADAITVLGQNPDLLALIPEGSILTPHLAEFDRLLGKTENHPERLAKASTFCRQWRLNLLVKGANSVICLADGRHIFNSSGSQYMATAGAGDVLTGMLTSFLGQGYSPEQALVCGVYQHGLAGEIAGKSKRRGTIASDLVEAIPETYLRLNVS